MTVSKANTRLSIKPLPLEGHGDEEEVLNPSQDQGDISNLLAKLREFCLYLWRTQIEYSFYLANEFWLRFWGWIDLDEIFRLAP